MHVIVTVFGLLFLFSFSLAYVALNVLLAMKIFPPLGRLLRSALECLRRGLPHVEEFFFVQFKRVSTTRMYVTIGLQVGATIVTFYILSTPHSLFAVGTTLLGYVFAISAITLSLLSRMPHFRSLWEDSAIKVGLLVVPAYVGFVSKGYASDWIGRTLHTSASNTPMALFAATAFLLCLAISLVLASTALVFEFAHFFNIGTSSARTKIRRYGVSLVLASSFFATFIAAYVALEPSKAVGSVLISAIAFDFDAGPATECSLDSTQEHLSTTSPDAIIKALHLSSSQERALLVQRPPGLFREIVYRKISKEEIIARQLKILPAVDCYKDPKAPDPSASQATSKSA